MRTAPPDPPASPRPLTTPTNIAAACAAVCALTCVFYVGGAWAVLLMGLLTDGLIAILWLAAAGGFGGAILSAGRFRFESIALHIACAAAMGLGSISILVLLLGLGGWLGGIVTWAIIVVGLALCVWRGLALARQKLSPPMITPWSWLWLLAMPGLGIAIACAFLPPGILWGPDEPNGYDVVSYHFQLPREWFELGRIQPLTHNVFSFFPLGVEMHYLLAMHLRGGAWTGMYLAQCMHLGFMVLTLLAIYGILREMKAGHPLIGAFAAATTPWIILLAPIGYNEGGLLLFSTLAVGLMMLTGRDSVHGLPAPLRLAALAGAFAGFACGTKLTAVPMVLLAVPLAASVFPIRRWALLAVASYLLVGGIVFSPWLIRNLVWTGNPVFPEATTIVGRAHFSDEQVHRWRQAHSPREDQRAVPARLQELARQVLLDWRFGFALVPLAIVGCFVEWRATTSRYLLAMLVLLALFWLFFTHLQSRFFILAVPLSAMLIGQIRRRDVATIFAAILAVAAVVGTSIVSARLLATPQIFQAIGLERLTLLTPLADVTMGEDDHLALVGEAKPFLYDVPAPRLYYRTVFDVDAQPGETSVDAWLRNVPLDTGRTIVLIDPSELARFARTYHAIPPPPPDIAQRQGPQILRR